MGATETETVSVPVFRGGPLKKGEFGRRNRSKRRGTAAEDPAATYQRGAEEPPSASSLRTPRADTDGIPRTCSRLRGKQARANELIAKGDGYTFIAAPRSPDLRHTEKRRRHLCYCVCVCSVYYQPNSSRRGGPLSRPPAGCALCGSVGNPFDRVWLPTTTGHLQPVFSCVDSRGTHPLRVYVREYGTHTHVVCTWVCVG